MSKTNNIENHTKNADIIIFSKIFEIARLFVTKSAGQADQKFETLKAIAEGITLIGEGQFGALSGQLLGDAPGYGILVGDAHDKTALAFHQLAGRENGIRHLDPFQIDRG